MTQTHKLYTARSCTSLACRALPTATHPLGRRAASPNAHKFKMAAQACFAEPDDHGGVTGDPLLPSKFPAQHAFKTLACGHDNTQAAFLPASPPPPPRL